MYRVEIIDMRFVHTVDDFLHAQNEAELRHFERIKDAENELNIKLHRERAGYSATVGSTMYNAYKI